MSKFLVTLRMYITDTIEPTFHYHSQMYEADTWPDLYMIIARDNRGQKYDIIQITLLTT